MPNHSQSSHRVIPLTHRLLALVLAIQSKRKLIICEAEIFQQSSDWFPKLRDYISTLPLEQLGLPNNDATIVTLAHGVANAAQDEACVEAWEKLPIHFGFDPDHAGIVRLGGATTAAI